MIITTTDFNLKDTIESGQIFRFVEKDGKFTVFTRDQAFWARQDGSKLHFDGASRKFVKNYLGLGHELAPIVSQINKDKHLNTATQTHSGLRVMKQDPWEALVSFVCSSCASIPKIKINLNALSKKFGERIEVDGVKGYTFPVPGSLNSLTKIKNCSTGYRSKYLFALNGLSDDELASFSKLGYDGAKEKLLSFNGVGHKVADCILLFGYNHFNAFPVDTWIMKGMRSLYFSDKPVKEKEIREFADDYFGNYAGYAQQYLFHWLRNQTI